MLFFFVEKKMIFIESVSWKVTYNFKALWGGRCWSGANQAKVHVPRVSEFVTELTVKVILSFL